MRYLLEHLVEIVELSQSHLETAADSVQRSAWHVSVRMQLVDELAVTGCGPHVPAHLCTCSKQRATMQYGLCCMLDNEA